MKKIKVFFTALMILLSTMAFAQKVTVQGTVTDGSNKAGVAFASVVEKGTSNGVSTDADGKFSIAVSANGTLVFSSVGYITAEVQVNGQTTVNVILNPDSEMLDETIVVAYGTATKSSFTGSASVVDSKSIETHVATSVTSALAGTTPGVQIISSSGDPAAGGSSTIRIRGVGSMSASNSPLVVLDGMPYDGSISDINPNDVASMTVLKDAAASAIYGARGANGVILITTKKAKSGDATIRLDVKLGSNSRLIPNYDVITSPAEYYETHYTQMYNSKYYSGASVTEAYAYADENLFNKNNGGLGYNVYTVPEGQNLIGHNFKINPNAVLGYDDGEYYYQPDDWYNEVFHNSFRQEYNLSISGAKDRFNYYASFGFLSDGGIVDNSGYKRYTGRVNVEYQVKDWLKLSTNLSYAHADSQTASYSSSYGSSGNIFYITNMMAPIYPLYVRESGTHAIMKDSNGNPVYDANQTNFQRAAFVGNAVRDNLYDRKQNYSDVFTGKAGLLITPFEGFSVNANIGLTNDNTRYNALYSTFASSSSVDGQAYVSHSRYFGVNAQVLAEYKTDFGGSRHNLDVLAGYESFQYLNQGLAGTNDHLFDPFIGELSNADGTDSKDVSSSSNRYLTMGYFARAEYNYDERIVVSGSYRRDASSRFAPGHRWGNFGSASAAWVISKENWFNSSWVDFLKVKASYGVLGNDNLGSLYPYTDHYSHSYNSSTGEYSIALSYKGNEDLTWESSHSVNVGVDLSLWKGKLNATVEGYSRITSNLLYNKDVPLSSGNPTGYMPVNVGSIANTGVEVSLDGNIINTQNVKWDWNLNISTVKNTILALDPSVAEEGIKGSNYIYRIGGSLYQAYMRRYAGVNPETGKAQWYYEKEDEDGNTTTEITETFSQASQYDLGTIMPKVYGGFGTTLNLYGFDLSAQFSYQLGGKYYDGTYQALMHTSSGTGMAWHKDVLNSWSETNKNTNIPRLDGDTSVSQTACDCFLISSNYLSVNNVTLGYTLPKKWMDQTFISSVRIYVAGENLGVVTARKGIDPRYSMGLGSMTSGAGLNSGSYSAMRNITGGLTISF